MQVEALFAEIGSTTTVVSAFDGLTTDAPRLLGQGAAPTSVEVGDVLIGLNSALETLREELGTGEIFWERFCAASSAAGGLRMSVHGLVYDKIGRAHV